MIGDTNMKIKIIISLLTLFLLFTRIMHSNNSQIEYRPEYYTKQDVVSIFKENEKLFYSVVKVLRENEDFYNKGRLNEYEDAQISSFNDKKIQFFNNKDKLQLEKIFKFKPYMLSYDYARRFIKITFFGRDESSLYVFIFWQMENNEDKEKFDEYVSYIKQKYIVESVSEDCILCCSREQ